jgi:hypothetical protein
MGRRQNEVNLAALRAEDGHRFLADDVSLSDADVPTIVGNRQVTDAHLLTLARRRGVRSCPARLPAAAAEARGHQSDAAPRLTAAVLRGSRYPPRRW